MLTFVQGSLLVPGKLISYIFDRYESNPKYYATDSMEDLIISLELYTTTYTIKHFITYRKYMYLIK